MLTSNTCNFLINTRIYLIFWHIINCLFISNFCQIFSFFKCPVFLWKMFLKCHSVRNHCRVELFGYRSTKLNNSCCTGVYSEAVMHWPFSFQYESFYQDCTCSWLKSFYGHNTKIYIYIITFIKQGCSVVILSNILICSFHSVNLKVTLRWFAIYIYLYIAIYWSQLRRKISYSLAVIDTYF